MSSISPIFERFRWSRALLAVIIVSVLSLNVTPARQQPVAAVSSEDQAVLNKISSDALRANLSFIASDLLEGRDTPSRGLDIAAEFIAAQFRRAGLEPIGDDGYYQTANMLLTVPQPIGFSLNIRDEANSIEVAPDQVTMYQDEGLSLSRAKLIKLNVSDAAALAGLTSDQVTGKVVAIERVNNGWREIIDKLQALKPALVIVVEREIIKGRGVASNQLIDPGKRSAEKPSAGTPFMGIKNTLVLHWFDEVKPGLTGATLSLHAPASVEKPVTMRNVIGMLRGSDPVLKDSYILVTAHYDHLGIDLKGRIYNGANDNGSGTVSVIELASALASRATRPKRSLVFMTFFGEEKGDVGSEYYVNHPVLPLEKTVANVNLEQMGRTDSSEGPQIASATVTGFDFSDMTATFIAAGKLTGIRIYKHEKYSDPFFLQSDNAALARAGVPAHTIGVVFVYSDYHDVGDKWIKIDFDNMAKVDRMLALGIISLANASTVPHWNDQNPKTKAYVDAWKARHQ